jgi:hypothetical protein
MKKAILATLVTLMTTAALAAPSLFLESKMEDK